MPLIKRKPPPQSELKEVTADANPEGDANEPKLFIMTMPCEKLVRDIKINLIKSISVKYKDIKSHPVQPCAELVSHVRHSRRPLQPCAELVSQVRKRQRP
jgi:hypothetical protein